MTLSFATARNLILENVVPVGIERVELLAAAGRVLAETVIAPWDMPRWDNSAMDGYAVRSHDCSGQVKLAVSGYLPAGVSADGVRVARGAAVKIMTGAPTPSDCDTVVPFEETEEFDGEVRISQAVVAGSHIRLRGEDVREGEAVMGAGTVLSPAAISMLASFDVASVAVYRRPRVAVLANGDELVPVGTLPGSGQVTDSNSMALAAAIQAAGAEPVLLGIAKDNEESLRVKIAAGLDSDLLISSAGVSAGDRDLVREMLSASGVREIFWKIDIKPGRPTAFGLKDGKPVFSLPGNPVSSLITFEMLVRPALLKMQGYRQAIQPLVKAALGHAVEKKAGRTQFLRMIVSGHENARLAESAGDQNTGILKTMLLANGICVLPADGRSFAQGDLVDIHLLSDQGGCSDPA